MKPIIFLIALFICISAPAKMRTWNLNDGTTIEGEFILMNVEYVLLAAKDGSQQRITLDRLTDEELSRAELLSPPRFNFELFKKSETRRYPEMESNGQMPSTDYLIYTLEVRRTLPITPYRHEMTAEFFVMGEEVAGDKGVLLDYQKATFKTDEKGYVTLDLITPKIELTRFLLGDVWRGVDYDGWCIVITDIEGKIIASETKIDKWVKNYENIREVPIGKYFNDEGKRCFPTRPIKLWN